MRCPDCAAIVADTASSCPRCGLSLQDAREADEHEGTHAAAAEPVTAAFGPGALVGGQYRIERFLAAGGMGAVYLGLDVALARRVAIKFLADHLARDPTTVRRFLSEARAAASLDHPNLIAVHAFGEHEGRPYLVMKYIEGRTLADLLREKVRLSLGEAVGLLVQVCDGLDAVHARGYVHRDIKPHNVMVEPSGRCIILDFGILRDTAKTTSTGFIAGTPAYIAPEQAHAPTEVDARADLYSLGVTLFELVTGRLPFQGRSAFELLMKHQAEPPPAPSSLVPSLGRGVDAVVARALAKVPRERFDDAQSFKSALLELARSAPDEPRERAEFGEAEPTVTDPRSTDIRALGHGLSQRGAPELSRALGSSSPRRSRAGVFVVAAVALGVLAVVWWLAREDPQPTPTSAGPTTAPLPTAGATGARLPAPAIAAAPVGVDVARAPIPRVVATMPPTRERDDETHVEVEPSRSRRAPKKPAPVPLESSAPPAAAPSLATLRVESSPSDARIFLGGVGRGNTPKELRVAPATYLVEVRREGHEPYAQEVSVAAGDSRTVRAALRPKRGKVSVVVRFEGRGMWADISIDGRSAARSHVALVDVAAGAHEVVVRRDGFRVVRRSVRVGPGALEEVDIALEKVP